MKGCTRYIGAVTEGLQLHLCRNGEKVLEMWLATQSA